MTLAMGLECGYPFAPTIDRGLSDEALKVRRLAWQSGGFTASITFNEHRNTLLTALKEAFSQSQEHDWDAYNARPADPASFVYALHFLVRLPTSTIPPEIAVDADGEVAVEWDFGPRRVFSVRVGRDGTLSYAGLVGHASFHGVELFREGIPKTVSAGLERVLNQL